MKRRQQAHFAVVPSFWLGWRGPLRALSLKDNSVVFCRFLKAVLKLIGNGHQASIINGIRSCTQTAGKATNRRSEACLSG